MQTSSKLRVLAALSISLSFASLAGAQDVFSPGWLGPITPERRNVEFGSLGVEWLDVGPERGSCRILIDAETRRPLQNPHSKDAYAVEAEEGSCPQKLQDGASLVAFESYAVRDNAVRLYAPWGRTFIFRWYPYVEGWGHDQRFTFKWISPEDF